MHDKSMGINNFSEQPIATGVPGVLRRDKWDTVGNPNIARVPQ